MFVCFELFTPLNEIGINLDTPVFLNRIPPITLKLFPSNIFIGRG